MASLTNVVRENHMEIKDGIAWVVIYKAKRSWLCNCYWPTGGDYEEGFKYSSEDIEEMVEILSMDENAIMINGYYMPLGHDFSLSEMGNKIKYFYLNSFNLLRDYFKE